MSAAITAFIIIVIIMTVIIISVIRILGRSNAIKWLLWSEGLAVTEIRRGGILTLLPQKYLHILGYIQTFLARKNY